MNNIKQRVGEEKLNYQGFLMRIVIYNNSRDIIVEFQDDYRGRVHTNYVYFSQGKVRNPYAKCLYNVGITGNKYKTKINNELTKEYITWRSMLKRCFDSKYKQLHPTYLNATCCDEWLLFENFYEWLHIQPNFKKWFENDKWAIDKDILIKKNKKYSPSSCCLVPFSVNSLFVTNNSRRGNLPIGVEICNNKYQAKCRNPFFKNKVDSIGVYDTAYEAFINYKRYKEDIIKQVAQKEYNSGNISEKCYNAMMMYEVEITD